MSARRPLLVAALGLALANSAAARTLDAVQQTALAVCAHPDALPFATKKGEAPGFQIELAEALAARLGVALQRQWVMNVFQQGRAGCDIVLDVVADKGVEREGVPLKLTRPYHRSRIVGAVRSDARATALTRLEATRPVGVQVGSLAAMTLQRKGVATTPFARESDMLDALARGQIDGAAVTQAAIGWYNATHGGVALREVPAFDDGAELAWNVGVGMLRPDDKLRAAVDAAVEGLIADGTIARIYVRYGAELRAPQ